MPGFEPDAPPPHPGQPQPPPPASGGYAGAAGYPAPQPESQRPYYAGQAFGMRPPRQAGWTPEAGDPRRYGRVGSVPWTLRQTVIGAALTIVPWVVIIISVQLLPTSGGLTKRIPTSADIISGITALVVTAIVEGAFLIAPFVVAVRLRPPGTSARDGLRALGFRKAPLGASVAWVVGGFVVVLLLDIAYGLIVTHFNLPLQTNGQTLSTEATYAPITVLCSLIGAVFVAPFCEEVFFRGYLFGGLLHGMTAWAAVPVAALLFCIVHGDLGSAALLFAIGVILAIMRYRFGSLWPGMALHALNNAIAAATILPIIFGGTPPLK
ncbi:MAG: CPBP family intramembrane glutamic endopeptidase [Ktedonobacterales bacterium]